MSINRRGFLGALVAPFMAKAGQRLTRFAKHAAPVTGMRVNAGKVGDKIEYDPNCNCRGCLYVASCYFAPILGMHRIGDTIHVKLPPRFMAIDGVMHEAVNRNARIQS